MNINWFQPFKLTEYSEGGFGAKDYSDFSRTLWQLRLNESHRRSVEQIQRCKTKTNRQQEESRQGCRYSVLFELSYFDPIRMVILDPMHNLFSGSANYVTKQLLLEKNHLTQAHLKSMQEFIDRVHVPVESGRIPHKVSSGFSNFTANQYKNWVSLYSIPSRYGRIETQCLECWRSLVLACRLLCKPSLASSDIDMADRLLMKFCLKIEQLFGKQSITPNMHMHGHLKAVIEDFGPLHGFWLFAYERFSGILGSYPDNYKSIKPQITKKFLNEMNLFSHKPPIEHSDVFQDLMPNTSLESIYVTAENDFVHVSIVLELLMIGK